MNVSILLADSGQGDEDDAIKHGDHTARASVDAVSGNDSDDATLVRAAQSQPVVFGTLYQRYLSRVYHYARMRMTGDEDAADLTQQVFLQALDSLPRYQERGVPFSAWLFRIARNLATDAHRHRRPTVAWDQLTAEPPHDAEGPEAALLRQETSVRLRGLVAALPADKREMLALRFAAGLTAREIAHVVGKSEAAVHKQINRTLKVLKEQYKESWDE